MALTCAAQLLDHSFSEAFGQALVAGIRDVVKPA